MFISPLFKKMAKLQTSISDFHPISHFRLSSKPIMGRKAKSRQKKKLDKKAKLRKKGDSWPAQNLPDDIWSKILSRLPVEPLLRFRCVSKPWQSMIDDPNFCRLHLSRFHNNRHRTHLLAVQQTPYKDECVVRCSRTFNTTARLATLASARGETSFEKIGHPGGWRVQCSLDGLVMLKNIESRLLLWNPSIRKVRSLPSLPPEMSDVYYLGLGFDPILNDYKYVCLVGRDGDQVPSVAIYTVGTASWKIIPSRCKGGDGWRWFQLGIYLGDEAVCCSGFLCFIAMNMHSGELELVSFDLGHEVFGSIGMPRDEDIEETGFMSEIFSRFEIVDGRGSLVKFNPFTNRGSVWVLECPDAESESMYWEKRCSFRSGIPNFLLALENGDMLLGERAAFRFDYETSEMKLVGKTRQRHDVVMLCNYIESLVLLK